MEVQGRWKQWTVFVNSIMGDCHTYSTVDLTIDGQKARPALPDRHFVPGHAGPWDAPPAQAQPTSRRAGPKARVAHRAFF